MSKTIQTLTAFQNPDTSVVANGSLVLQLTQDAKVTTNGQICPTTISFNLNASGQLPASTIIANDEMTPSGLTYTAKVFNSNGLLVYGPENWSIAGASPIDLATLTPAAVGASFPNPVLLSPSGNQEITVGDLILDQKLQIKGGQAQSITITRAGGAAARTATLPDNTGTIAELNLAQTFSASQTFSAVISSSANPAASAFERLASGDAIAWRNNANAADILLSKNTSDQLDASAFAATKNTNVLLSGTVQNNAATATMGVTQKSGSGAGNYTTVSASYVDVDTTNLSFAVTVPTGWKAFVTAAWSGAVSSSVGCGVAITDVTTVLRETSFNGTINTAGFVQTNFAGDGASHTFRLRFHSDGVQTLTIQNANGTIAPTMEILLLPSN